MAATLTRRRVVDVVRIALLVLVLVAVGVSLARNWSQVSTELGKVGPGAIVVAAVAALASPVLTMLGWRVVMADLGTRLHLAEAGSIYFVGQLGKYLPGSVWTVVTQAEMGSRLGVPRQRSAIGGVVLLAMSVLTGAFVGLPALPVLLTGRGGDVPWWLVAVAVVLAVVALSPPALNRGIALGLRLLRRPPLEHALTTPAVLLTLASLIGSWVVMGAAVWVMAASVAPAGTGVRHLALVSVCGYTLAGIVGMVSFLVPAGVGVRDGVLVLLLGTLMPVPTATAVVVLSRFLTVVADVVVALGGWLWGRRHHLLGSTA